MDYIRVDLPYRKKSKVLALGAQSKGSFCFVKKEKLYLSDSFGDLADLKNFSHFQKEVRKFKPEIIACDLHPEYISTKFAYELVRGNREGIKKIQHHEAHVASCIVDNSVKGNVIGVAFDGTGFGKDGNIWGGEFFVGSVKGFKRVAHLEYVPMPGGEAAVREPWRMALSYLYSGTHPYTRCVVPHIGCKGNIELLVQAIEKGINSPLTSSVGRLFDAVSAMLGICKVAKYEGQAAVELEKQVSGIPEPQGFGAGRYQVSSKRYKFDYIEGKKSIIIDWKPVIRGIARDLEEKRGKPEISLKFHNAICNMVKDVCNLLREKYKISKVCLSGGVFQNKYLRENIRSILEEKAFKVYLHKNIPCHDGGIAVGQAVLAMNPKHTSGVCFGTKAHPRGVLWGE